VSDKQIEKNLQGLGGWLIIVGIGIVVGPFKNIITIVPIYERIFEGDVWNNLTTPGTSAYHPFWSTFISLEIILNAGLLIATVYLAYLFFTKRKQFPKFYIGLAVFTLVFIFIDALGSKVVFPNEPFFDPDFTKQLIQSLLVVVIWVPYMLRSKRVKATFIE
jgi:hypothetical protein